MDIKKVLEIIIANLHDMETKVDILNVKVDAIEIPDVSKIMARFVEIDKKIFDGDKARRQLSEEFEGYKNQTNIRIDGINEAYVLKDNELEEMIQKLIREIELLKKRPVTSVSNIDTDLFASKDEF